MHHVQNIVEICAHDIHFIYIDESGHMIMICLAPDRFGLRFYAALCAEDGNASIQNAQASLYFSRKVNVARCVNDVYAVILPEAGGCSGSYRDSALLFLLHPVHGRRAFMHLTQLVSTACVKQDPLRRCRLSGIDMGHYSDISGFLQRILPRHIELLISVVFGITSDNARRHGWTQPSCAYLHAS